MQTQSNPQMKTAELTLKGLLEQDFANTQNLAYHEMEAIPVQQVNELAQLSANVEMLSQIRSKLQFMNREIRYLMKV